MAVDVEQELSEAQQQAEEFVVAISRLSEAAQAMLDAGLTREALVLLIRHKANVRKQDVENVLWALPRLA